MHACRSCCELIDTHALSHRSEVVADFHYRLKCESLIFARFSAAGMRVSLYVGWLIRKYIWYLLCFRLVSLDDLFKKEQLECIN